MLTEAKRASIILHNNNNNNSTISTFPHHDPVRTFAARSAFARIDGSIFPLCAAKLMASFQDQSRN